MRIDGNDRFAISAPENGISASFGSEVELETALEKLGFRHGFSLEVVHALESRGIVWLELEGQTDPEILREMSDSIRSH